MKKDLEDLLVKIEFAALTGTNLDLNGSEVQVLYEHLKSLKAAAGPDKKR